MKALLMLIGMAALLAGLLFAGQGAGIITWPSSSFMVGAGDWVLYGFLIAAVGVVLLVLGGRRRT